MIIHEITEECFKKVKELVIMDNEYINNILDFFPFGDDERYRGKYLLDNTQNAKKWIVGKYREKFWCKYWNYTNNVVQWVYQQQK